MPNKLMTVTQAADIVKVLELRVVNERWPVAEQIELFNAIGRYRYLGGKQNFIKDLRTLGIADRFGDDKAQQKYMDHAIRCVMAAEIYLGFMYVASVNKLKGKNNSGICDITNYINKHMRKTIDSYDLDFRIINGDTLMILKEGQRLLVFNNINTWDDIMNIVVPDLVRCVSGIIKTTSSLSLLDNCFIEMVSAR